MTSTEKIRERISIPTKTLPKDWREQGAKKFDVGISTIEKIVYGQRKDAAIFKFMLELAEKKTADDLAEEQELATRVKALTQ